MSRSVEEQLLLDQRIQEMKQKNEALRRRHMEVEADKQSAAKQNALVKMNVPHDDDWVPGRHVESPRQDRSHQQNEPLSPSNPDRNDDKGQWSEQRRRNDGRRDEGHSSNRQYEDAAFNPRQNAQNFSGRRNDYHGNRQKSDGDRSYSNENRRFGDWPNRSNDGSGSGGRQWEWGSQSHRGFKNNGPSSSGDASRGYPSTFTSKVYKNSSMDQDRGKRPAYRLAEGDGPPPDPSYSFLGDSMRDSPESGERRRGFPKRSFPRGRGRGGQTWNNRGSNDLSNGGEDRGEMQPRHHEDSKHDEWRRERTKIDQERINRQKTSDGNWSREWDSNKVLQEGTDRPHRWRRGNQTQNYGYSQSRRGNLDDAGNTSRQNSTQEGDPPVVPRAAGITSDDADSPLKTKLPRRGRFAYQHRFKDNTQFSNGSGQQTSNEPVTSKDSEDAGLIETNVKIVEQLQVSLVCDPSGTQVKRSVEGVGGNLRISVGNDGETSDCKNAEQKRPRKSSRKGKRSRILSSTSTGTTDTGEENDGSWEDLSSDEEDVSVVMELGKVPRSDTSKCVDVSSGPESLDPIPAPGKEDEFLWDDFHPAGFQDNATINLEAEAAYQALLDEKAKQVAAASDSQETVQPHQVSFRLDTACLEDSSDELQGAKLDPLLVTTQIVQAEVDCMSLTSIPTDTSLPDEVSQFIKTKSVNDDKVLQAAKVDTKPIQQVFVSAEELSGPVSILDVPPMEVSSVESNSVDRSIHREEESPIEPLVVVMEDSSVDLEAAVITTNEVSNKDASVKCEREEEKVVDEVKIPDTVTGKSDVETVKEEQANTLDEQKSNEGTEDCVIKADSPAKTLGIEKCQAESLSESASNILLENQTLDNIPVQSCLVSCGNEPEFIHNETKRSSGQSPQASEDVSEIVPANPALKEQEDIMVTCDDNTSNKEPKGTCEKVVEGKANSVSQVNDVQENHIQDQHVISSLDKETGDN